MFAFLKTFDTLGQNRHVKKVVGSNITAFYAVLSVLYFFIQLAVLISSLDNGSSTGIFVGKILNEANINANRAFAFVDGEEKQKALRICPEGIAHSASRSSCPLAFPNSDAASRASTLPPEAYIPKRDLTMVPVFIAGNLTSFMILDTGNPEEIVTLSSTCVQTLTWPYQQIQQTRKAEISVVFAHIFLLVLCVATLFSQSMSLVGSSFFLQVAIFGLSIGQLASFISFRSQYKDIISSATGACAGVDMLASFLGKHLSFVIAKTVVDAIVLCLMGFLSYRLFLEYGWAQFRMLQAAVQIRRAYVASLMLFTILPLEMFFYLASSGLWLDEITSHLFGARPSLPSAILAVQIISSVFLIPWLSLPYLGIQRENNKFLIAFFSVSVLYIVGWGVMFSGMTFRQSFVLWPFMGVLFVISYILLVITIGLTIMCSFHFGIGVPDYLNGRHNAVPLAGSRSATPISSDDIEKLTLRNIQGEFIVNLPFDEKIESPPQRTDSLKSKKLILLERSRSSRMPVAAAQPGVIKIQAPPTALTHKRSMTSTTPSRSTTMSKASARSRNDNNPFWGKGKRHESNMSFGHLDASRLDASYTDPSLLKSPEPSVVSDSTRTVSSREVTATQSSATDAVERNPRMDSVGSIYSTRMDKPRLYLVTDL